MQPPNSKGFFDLFPEGLICLRDGNFTPPERTPWGGFAISRLKRGPLQNIGESWEVSTHDRFPSRVQIGSGTLDERSHLLQELLLLSPEEILGWSEPIFPLLIKFISTSAHLSLQVHPSDATAQRGEQGKEEAWYILAAEKNASLFIGLSSDATPDLLRERIKNEEGVEELFTRVSVQAGDLFHVPPGIPHAIGKGILLLECQQSSETTFRYWDWNRKPARELHLERAIQETDWSASRGEALLQQLRTTHGNEETEPKLTFLLREKYFSMARASIPRQGMKLKGKTDGSCIALSVAQGDLRIRTERGESIVKQGSSLLIPAGVHEFELEALSHEGGNAMLCIPHLKKGM